MDNTTIRSKEDLKKRIEEIGDMQRKLYETPEKEKGSWLQETLLDHIFDYIRNQVYFRAERKLVNGDLCIDVVVRVSGRTIFYKQIKIL